MILTPEQLNRLAQYVYEAIADSDGIELTMNMTGKPVLVDALAAALKRL